MSLLNSRMSLYEIEERLEEEFLNSMSYLRIIGDMDLSNEDFKYLSFKIKGLNQLSYDISNYEMYKLALLTSCVFNIKKEQQMMGNFDVIRKLYLTLPQHHLRYFIELFEDTLNEYGISTFEMDTKHFDGLFSILITHAGLPEHLHSNLYDILDEALEPEEMHNLEERIRNNFIPQINCWMQYYDEKRLWTLFNDCKDLLIDCKGNELGRDELLKKYNWLSSKLIFNCINWCEECEYLRQQQIDNLGRYELLNS